jgi:hypothetical protein
MTDYSRLYAENRRRGVRAEKFHAGKYGGTASDSDAYDREFEHFITEIKSAVAWSPQVKGGRLYAHKGRFLIKMDNHVMMQRLAERMGKMAVYCFFGIPVYEDCKWEIEPEKWLEKWLKWRQVDDMLRDPSKKRTITTVWHNKSEPENLRYIYVREIFPELEPSKQMKERIDDIFQEQKYHLQNLS